MTPQVPGLRSLTLFGSCLSARTRRPDSIPDWLAVVDDVDAVLSHLGHGSVARAVARWLPPPTTVAPKLNLVEPGQLLGELEARRDLYFAGRLGKRTELVWSRDAECTAELERAHAIARATMADVATWGTARDTPLDVLVRRCVALSYEAEVRPERPEKIAALHDAFADWYRATYAPLLEHALQMPDPGVRALERLLRRSRRRSVLRWPKGLVLYDGALRYVAAKLRRARTLPEGFMGHGGTGACAPSSEPSPSSFSAPLAKT
jgi:hypothetical protein